VGLGLSAHQDIVRCLVSIMRLREVGSLADRYLYNIWYRLRAQRRRTSRRIGTCTAYSIDYEPGEDGILGGQVLEQHIV
jgi:hypothetical protein